MRLTVPYVPGGTDADLNFLTDQVLLDGIGVPAVHGAVADEELLLLIGNDLFAPAGRSCRARP
ncbi:hypothetical protein [Microbacterium sp. NIBRBAC000506063]|uniref:hypothetical protein n=1 Tax=Microbacterium sp. NIBRBAC000506063 TaxID=2734618 RepID=UPI001BB57872|nr:hypothetical protein [Microbacterium sp. NIBRBAC000506063]QTV78950.1 hypothetical protein KAE78_07030 [Microbacterium sp. NIBRBAC000506063]